MSLTRTPLAAISYNDASGVHIRVYYQAPNGDIKEASFDEGSSWAPSSTQATIGTGKLNSGIAAVTWSTSTGQSIRVFYLAPDNTITERNKDGTSSWSNGALTGKFKAAPYSKIAAVTVQQNDNDVRVYYQNPSNNLQELLFTHSASWHAGATLPSAFLGSSIAANIVYARSGQIWVYYQDTDTSVKELWYDGAKYNTGGFTATSVFPPGASLSAVLWSGSVTYDRVASVDELNQVCITPCNGPWGSTVNVGEESITLSDVALVSINGLSDLRLYYQQTGGAIAELATSDGDNWSPAAANILG